MRRLQPKKFTEEQLNSLQKAVSVQSVSTTVEKSLDPVHFPVFEVPVNQKVFIYVPNHVITDEDGNEELRMDKPFIHSVKEGTNRFSKVRCIKNLPESAGYSGNCPFCDAIDDGWALANEIIKEKCETQGLDPDDKANDAVKNIRSAAYNSRPVTAPDQYYTFPIVVIETNPNNFKEVVRDEEGKIKFKAMWYSISKAAYQKKWVKALENMEEDPDHPGGHCFVLDYTYEPKSGEPNKRDSARELVVISKKMKNFDDYATYFDKITEDWTPEKAMETVADNVFAEESDLQEEADKIMIPTRDKLALYRSLGVDGAAALPGNGEGFQMSETKAADDSGVGEETFGVPVETDLD